MVNYIPVLQLSSIKSVVQIHHPSVCRNVPLLQLDEHLCQNILRYKLEVEIQTFIFTQFERKQRHC